MQSRRNAKTSLPTEYLCRTAKGLYLDKNSYAPWRLLYWFSRCCTIVAWPVTAGITDTLCICSELSVWFSCDFFLDSIYRRYRRLFQRLVSVKICWISTFCRLRRHRRHFSESFTKFSSARDVKGHSRSSYDGAEPEAVLQLYQKCKGRLRCVYDSAELEIVLPFCQRQKKCFVCACDGTESEVSLPFCQRWKNRSGCIYDGTEPEVALPFYQKAKEMFHMCVWLCRVRSSLIILPKVQKVFRVLKKSNDGIFLKFLQFQ